MSYDKGTGCHTLGCLYVPVGSKRSPYENSRDIPKSTPRAPESPNPPVVATNASSSSSAGPGSNSSSSHGSGNATSGSTPRTQSSSSSGGSSSASSARSSAGNIGLIATMSAVGSVMLIIITFLAFKYIQKKKKKNARPSVESVLLSSIVNNNGDTKIELASTERLTKRLIEDFSRDTTKIFNSRELIEFTNDYKEKLGSGGFGEVFKGMYPNGVPVAVKVLKHLSEKTVNSQFEAELFTIGKTHHINLVRLYGFCFDKDTKALVYEYMDNGSLQNCLDNKNIKLEWGKLHQIAVGTARGIRYLHEECTKMIIHYDIKPANILLSKDYTPKVADFGMAEILDRESTILTVTQEGWGTPGFIAPELKFSVSATHKCDVYSFGMLLFQILGSRRDIEVEQSAGWVKEKAEQGELESVLSSCGIEEKDRVLAERMCKVALMCVQYRPAARPSMSGVLRMLEGEQGIGASPINREVRSDEDPKAET